MKYRDPLKQILSQTRPQWDQDESRPAVRQAFRKEMVNLWLPYFKISLSFLSGVQLDFTGNRV